MKNKKQKSFFQWFLAFFALLFVGVIASIGMISTVYAASISGFSVDGLTASYENGTWTATSTNGMTGSATGSAGGTCTSASSTTSTLTLKNTSGKTELLSFAYAKPTLGSGGSVKIDGSPVTATGNFSKSLANNASITIVILSGSAGANTSSISISNVTLVYETVALTAFKKVSVGSGTYTVKFTINETTTTKTVNSSETTEFENEMNSTIPYTLTANPSSGYKLMGWYRKVDSVEKFISSTSPLEARFEEDSEVTAKFISTDTPVFMVDQSLFTDLSQANAAATSSSSRRIILVQNGTLPAGNYTISSGNTLLIPFDDAHTCYTTSPAIVGHTTPSAYRTLSIGNGVTINVIGSISVSAKVSTTQKKNGSTSGKYGAIKFLNNSTSTINLQSESKLYCWGFIWGSGGHINALSGSSVYEPFQMTGWRGGTATCGDAWNAMTGTLNPVFTNNKIFPMNQYAVQNIEVPITFNSGSTETVFTAANVAKQDVTASIPFIGSSGMFKINSGSVTKSFSPSEDYLKVEIDGDVSVSSITIDVNPVTINSANFVLPINSNMYIHVKSGSTVRSAQDLAFFPSSLLEIENGGNFIVTAGNQVFVYDIDDWGNYAYDGYKYCSVPYTPNGSSYVPKTNSSLVDAKINLNGSITVNNGSGLYTTTHGANICSEGKTGSIVFTNGPGTVSTTYQATMSGSDMTAVSIPVTSAKLKNGPLYDGAEFFETSAVEAGKDVVFDADIDGWTTDKHTATTYTYTFYDPSTGNHFEESHVENDNHTMPTSNYAINNKGFNYNGYSIKKWICNAIEYTPGAEYPINGINLPEEDSTFTAFYGGWTINSNENNGYYIDYATGNYLVGKCDVNVFGGETIKTHIFDSTGKWSSSLNDGLFNYENGSLLDGKYPEGDNEIYYVENGIVQKGHGLLAFEEMNEPTYLYYVLETGKIVRNTTFYVSKTNHYYVNNIEVKPGLYYFDSNGCMYYGNELLNGEGIEFGIISSDLGATITGGTN